MSTKYKILVLDGGGSKGVYTLGVLKELEMKLGSPLYNHFDLIYGTSTGSIIGALIGLGYSIQDIKDLYFTIIPKIMIPGTAKGKSRALREESIKVFESKKFDSFLTNIGIVALNHDTQCPLIFKTDIRLAHGMKQSFKAGFDQLISTAVRCSCSAYPFFEKMEIYTEQHGNIEVVDGGFIANNSTLYSIVDATMALKLNESDLHILNVGVGTYVPIRRKGLKARLFRLFGFFQFVEKVLTASTNSNSTIAKLLFRKANYLRVSESFPDPELATDMFEYDGLKLEKLYSLGKRSYAKFESDIVELLK